MATQTSEEVITANVAKMGKELGEIYSALWQDVAILHFDWHEYIELFGTKLTRIDLMNGVAPHFFRLVQDRLWETTLLHLARLTDPAESPGKGGGRANLTIKALPEQINDAELKERLTTLIDDAATFTGFARDWRNRHIAHRDLKLVLEHSTESLADASRNDVKKALSAIAVVLNEVAAHYTDSYTAFDFGGPLGGSISLLYVLSIGSRARDERGKRLMSGTQTAEDLVIHDI